MNKPIRCAALALSLCLLVGCASSPAGESVESSGAPNASAAKTKRASATPGPTPEIGVVKSTSGLTAMRPTDAIEIPTVRAKVTKVTVLDSSGNEIPGTLDGNSWRPTRPFLVREKYRFNIEALGEDGQQLSSTAYGHTVNPEIVAEIDFLHTAGAGNGMPIWARFDIPVKDQEQRKAIMAAASVTTSPAQEGSWAWFDASTLYWRPKEYWRPGSTAHVEIKAAGLPVGETWVLNDVTADYQFGDLRVLRADIDGHRLTAFRNGEQVASFPASFGKPGDETMTGAKLIMAKEGTIIMDSSSYGRPVNSPDGYRTEVDMSQRITWSGEYIHAAPWADASHGNSNVSHGCTGLSNADAQWIWDFTRAGDPVEFTGSTRPVPPGDTYGGWGYSWEQWQAAGDGRLTAFPG